MNQENGTNGTTYTGVTTVCPTCGKCPTCGNVPGRYPYQYPHYPWVVPNPLVTC